MPQPAMLAQMANINELGNITARCVGCVGALASFEWRGGGAPLSTGLDGPPTRPFQFGKAPMRTQFRLYRCAGCGRGALAHVAFSGASFPDGRLEILDFYPEAGERLRLPKAVPKGLLYEFREAEHCIESRAIRAAAGLFRSVLDKTMRANGYKQPRTSLEQQIDAAAKDGIITESRRRKAHDEIRVLGNDVLHDEWREIPLDDVLAAQHYAQRILEDFYDDREAVLKLLKAAGRVAADDLEAKDQ